VATKKARATRAKKARASSLEALPPRRSSIRRLLSIVILVLTVVASIVALWPRVLVNASSEIADPLDPFILPFELENGGNLSVYSPKITCLPERIMLRASNSQDSQIQVHNQPFASPFGEDRLEAGHKRPFVCDVFRYTKNPQPIVAAQLRLGVSFAPIPYLPIRKVEHFIFVLTEGSDGKLRWSETPMTPTNPEYPPKF
jgi:hypothetical protein